LAQVLPSSEHILSPLTMNPLTLLGSILVASSIVSAWARSGTECDGKGVCFLQTGLHRDRSPADAPELDQIDLRDAAAKAHNNPSEPHVVIAEEGNTSDVEVCSVIPVPDNCACTKLDKYASRLNCSTVVKGPSGNNMFTLVTDIKPCVGPPTLVFTGSERNTGHSIQANVSANDAKLTVPIPGLWLTIWVADVGMNVVASLTDTGNQRLAISLGLDGCAAIGGSWSPWKLCGHHLTSLLPVRIFRTLAIDFSQACEGKTVNDGVPVQIWNSGADVDVDVGLGTHKDKCLVTKVSDGSVYSAGCSNQESIWTWTAEKAFKTTQSGKCLDSHVYKDGFTYAKTDACTGSLNQTWDWSDHHITNRATGKCLALTSDRGYIVLQDCAETRDQRWVWTVV